MSNSEKFLWVCELSKEMPSKKWKASDMMEFEDEDDRDFVINSLILKTAVLGAKAVENERNLVAIKTKGHQDKEFEQPIFSLTLGRNDMVSGLDLTVGGDQDVEFKLLEGTGPVYITCTHLIELPTQEEQPTMMTNSDVEIDEDESEDIEDEEDDEEEEKVEEKAKEKKKAPAAKNGTNGAAAAVAAKKAALNGKNGEHNGVKKDEEIEVNEKPNKRKRN